MRRLIVATLAGLVVGGGILVARHHRRAPAPTVHPVTEQTLLAADTASGWLTHGRDFANQRYAPFTQINRETVKRLAPIWRQGARRLIKSYLRTESTPVVVDGMLIYTDPGMRLAQPGNHVIAVDLATGDEVWSWYRKPGPAALCCGLVNRGVAVYGDKVYVGTLDAHLVALDRRTGAVAWDVQVEGTDPAQGYSFSMAPLAAGRKILIGSSGGEFSIRGFLDAYDPETGRRVWRFFTVPTPEEGGWWGRLAMTTPDGDPLPRDTAQERRDSAGYADAWKQGGGPVWTTPAYDPALGLVIFTIGNPSTLEGVPPGDNLYTSSIAAVDVASGKLRWYYQTIPHNTWDYDPASPPVLFDTAVDGDTVPAVAEAGKTGWVYILDRRTGKRLRRSEPFIPLKNPFPRPNRVPFPVSPGTRGGSLWPSAAYSPQTGALYVLGSYLPMRYQPDSATSAKMDQRSGHAGHLYSRFAEFEGDGRFGTFTAVDLATGKIRWQNKLKGPLMYGGAVATAGGLVFFPEPAYLNAVDAETGRLLWRHQLDKGPLGPPITFMDHGQQRVAVTSTAGVTVFGLDGK
jgi:PQQ-dependent dehydrogenase (methanol/ethanol family)